MNRENDMLVDPIALRADLDAKVDVENGLLDWDDTPSDLRAAVLGRAWALAGEGNPDISHYWRAITEVAVSRSQQAEGGK